MSTKVTERQRRFALAYAETGSVREAAARAGYSPHSARRALRSPGVQAALEALNRGPRAAPEGEVATSGEVLAYLTGVLRGECEGSSTSPRMKAAELLGKRLGLFSETPEPEPPPVIVDDV